MRSGLTLVELLATLAVTALVMVAVIPVTVNLARAQAIGGRSLRDQQLRAALHRLLEADVAQAEAYRPGADGAEFQLLFALVRREGLDAQHLPATAAYRVRRVAARGWLVRAQQSPLGGSLEELVCPDVREFTLTPADSDASDAPVGSEEWVRLPRAMWARVAFDGAGRPPIEFLLTVR
jgi:hypothetical protein